MVKWSTLGHSAVDVNLIAYGPNIEWLHGNHDNTEIGQFIAEQLGSICLPLRTSSMTRRMSGG
jgi:alkaline phosphatase